MEVALGAGRGLVAEHLVLRGIMDLMQRSRGCCALDTWWTSAAAFCCGDPGYHIAEKGIKNLEHDSMDLLHTQNWFLSMWVYACIQEVHMHEIISHRISNPQPCSCQPNHPNTTNTYQHIITCLLRSPDLISYIVVAAIFLCPKFQQNKGVVNVELALTLSEKKEKL
jgi:hypothetical protein